MEEEYIINNKQCLIKMDSPLLEGWEECKDLKVLKAYAPIAEAEIPTGLRWKGSRIPAALWSQVLGTAEAFPNMEIMLSLYYNRHKHEWRIKCTEQKGSAASVYMADDGVHPEPGFSLLGSIHTHPNMKAFWSSTDAAYQGDYIGIHIVLGITQGLVSTSLCSIRTKHGVYDQELDLICEPVPLGVPHEANAEWVETIKAQRLKIEEYELQYRKIKGIKDPAAVSYFNNDDIYNYRDVHGWDPKVQKITMPETSSATWFDELQKKAQSSNKGEATFAVEALDQVGKVRLGLAWLFNNGMADQVEDILDEYYAAMTEDGDDFYDDSDDLAFTVGSPFDPNWEEK